MNNGFDFFHNFDKHDKGVRHLVKYSKPNENHKLMYSFPFFTVVVPTYNCLELLKRALESVFSQTYQDFEIIVVDNSSHDETQNFLLNIDDSRIQIIIVQNNGVIAHSRNKGIENAKGKWIAFLDADDAWKPQKLSIVTESIGKNTDTILFCHDEWLVYKGKMQNRLKYGPSSSDVYERLLFKGNFLSTSAVILLKDVAITSGGFSEREDFAFSGFFRKFLLVTAKMTRPSSLSCE